MDEVWVFGYGSIIWNPGFAYADKRLATVDGYRRSFCQASHDHRGTPMRSGRVVTLMQSAIMRVTGVAFKLREPSDTVLSTLDIREQDGYERQTVDMSFIDGTKQSGLTWIAGPTNPSWRGGESLSEVAQVISKSSGLSGANSDYLFALHKALNALDIEDSYVEALANSVRIAANQD